MWQHPAVARRARYDVYTSAENMQTEKQTTRCSAKKIHLFLAMSQSVVDLFIIWFLLNVTELSTY